MLLRKLCVHYANGFDKVESVYFIYKSWTVFFDEMHLLVPTVMFVLLSLLIAIHCNLCAMCRGEIVFALYIQTVVFPLCTNTVNKQCTVCNISSGDVTYTIQNSHFNCSGTQHKQYCC
jgi:hypothetical protein